MKLRTAVHKVHSTCLKAAVNAPKYATTADDTSTSPIRFSNLIPSCLATSVHLGKYINMLQAVSLIVKLEGRKTPEEETGSNPACAQQPVFVLDWAVKLKALTPSPSLFHTKLVQFCLLSFTDWERDHH